MHTGNEQEVLLVTALFDKIENLLNGTTDLYKIWWQ